MTDNERIEKDAEDYADSVDRRGCSFWRGLKMGYVAASTKEHERMAELLKEERNKAIDDCIALVGNQPTIDASRWPEVKRKLESLKSQ